MKMKAHQKSRVHLFGRRAAQSETNGLGPMICCARKANVLRGLTLSLLALALFAGVMVSSRLARAGQDPKALINFSRLTSLADGAFRQKLMSEPSIAGTAGAADAQASVNVSELDQLERSIRKAEGETSAEADRSPRVAKHHHEALSPADTTPPPPAVTVLPTPLGPQSATDIPDFSMAASGPFIVTANSLTIYFQDGASNILHSSTLSAFFANVGAANPFGPQVLYDDMTDHFVIAALGGLQTSQSSVLLGVSDTADPTGTWTLYKFAADPQGQTSAGALSSIGTNSTWIVLSTAMFQNAQPNPFASSTVFVLDKSSLITSKTLSLIRFTDPGYLPCATKGYDETFPFVDIFTDWNGNAGGKGQIRHGIVFLKGGIVTYVAAAEFLSFPTTWDIFLQGNQNFVPQLGSSTGIYGGDGRITNAVFRNNMLYATHAAYRPAGGPDHMAVHWVTEDAVSGATQDGFIEGSGFTSHAALTVEEQTTPSFFGPSLTVSPSNDLLLGYNWSSASSYPNAGFVFRYGGQPSFGSFIPVLPSTGPSLAIWNGTNFGATTSATWPSRGETVSQANNRLDANKFFWAGVFNKTLQDVSFNSSTCLVSFLKPSFNQGILRADNGSLTGAVGAPPGYDLGGVIFGNLFPPNLVGGQNVSGMNFVIPLLNGSVQPGQTLNLYYGPVGSTLNGAPLTTTPYTVGQQNQFVTFNFPQAIQVPIGQSFFAGISGPGGLYSVARDTNLPFYFLNQSSADGGRTFSPDPYNYLIDINVPPPCTGTLDKPNRSFGAQGKQICIAPGHANCKPIAVSDSDWIVVDEVGYLPDTMVFNILYAVKPNTSPNPRFGSITVAGQVFDVAQAGANPLPPVTATPNSIGAGGSGATLTVNPSSRSDYSRLAPSAAGFTTTTMVAWNGEGRPTTVVSPTQLTAVLSADDIATPGTAQVTIFDLSPGGGTSPPVTVTITSGPDFSLSLDQPTVTAQAGTKARVTVNINRTGAFTGNVTVTPPDPQGGIKAKPADAITTTDTSVAFKLKIAGSVASGTYTFVIKGKDDSGRERDVTLTLVIQ